MIAGLHGVVSEKRDKSALIDVRGVLYEVFLSSNALGALPRAGQPVSLWTHLIPTDEALSLYGFLTRAELQLFDLLISINGIGPKLALNILTAGPVNEITANIAAEKSEYFLKVARLGKKTAARIVLELKNKIDSIFPEAGTSAAVVETRDDDLALQALVELGYTVGQAKEALARVQAQDPTTRVREALQFLGSHHTVTR